MYISNFQNYQNPITTTLFAAKDSVKPPVFTARAKMPLDFTPRDFFVHIKGYGKNYNWARGAKMAADLAVEDIKDTKSMNVNTVLINIAKMAREANQSTDSVIKQKHSGILRTKRLKYGDTGDWQGLELYTPWNSKYIGYLERFGETIKHPLENPYPDIDLSRPKGSIKDPEYLLQIVHGDPDKINNALDRVGGTYFNLKKDYILKPENITDGNLDDITARIAEMRWILAHATPWERGSDAIGNIFMRALYKSMGIKTYPLKEGVSLDLEAFCTPLDEYKKNFSGFFENPPKIVG